MSKFSKLFAIAVATLCFAYFSRGGGVSGVIFIMLLIFSIYTFSFKSLNSNSWVNILASVACCAIYGFFIVFIIGIFWLVRGVDVAYISESQAFYFVTAYPLYILCAALYNVVVRRVTDVSR